MIQMVLTIALASLGAVLFQKLKVPAGAYIGAVFMVGAFQLLTNLAYFPPEVKTLCSIISGSYIGTKVQRRDIEMLKKVPGAAAVMVVCLLAYNIASAWLLARFTVIDFGNALLGMAPGGASEFSIAAMDMGYDSATVSILQVMRLIIVVCITPAIAKKLLAKESSQQDERESTVTPPSGKEMWSRLGRTLLVGTIGGLFGKWSGLPAGTICWSMLSVAGCNVITGKMYFPLPCRRAASACSGALSGIRLSTSQLVLIRSALPVIFLIDLGWVLLGVLVGVLLYKRGGLTLETALFAAAPGGMTDMGLTAEEMGGSTAQVTVMQLCRTVSVLAACPWLVKLLVD